MQIQIISNLVISSLIFGLVEIGWSSKSLLAHTNHHQAAIKQEKKKHSEHHNQMHPEAKTKSAVLPTSTTNISVPSNSGNLPPTLAELILLSMIASPFLLHLLKVKMYNHE